MAVTTAAAFSCVGEARGEAEMAAAYWRRKASGNQQQATGGGDRHDEEETTVEENCDDYHGCVYR